MSTKNNLLIAAACAVAVAAGAGIYLLRPGAGASGGGGDSPVIGAQPAAPNEAVPAGIQLTDLDGKAYTLDDFKGKLVIVNFWATWCTPCLHEIPVLSAMQTRYGAKGFQLVGPAVDDLEEVKRAAPGLKFTYPVAVGEPEDMLDLMSKLGNDQGGLPFSVVIGPDGKVLERQLGEYSEVELVALIEKHLPK